MMNNFYFLLMVFILNLQFVITRRIDRISSFSQFHTTSTSKDDESFGRLSQFNLVKNVNGSSADERIGQVLKKMANYKRPMKRKNYGGFTATS